MDTNTESVVRVDGLTSRYGRHVAVDDLSLHVARGELYALLGTNGAGKTTTLETLEGFRKPSAGRVAVFGRDPGDRRTVRPRMGLMLQEAGIANELTVAEMLALTGAPSSRKDSVDRLLRVIRLEHRRDTRAAQLSGGEKRRLDFGCAIWGTPELLFLDEPTTGLDPEARDDLWEAVADLREREVTIVLTTHYLEEAERNADRIGLMHQGRLQAEGTLEQLVESYPSRISFLAPEGVQLPVPITATDGALAVVETDDLQRDLHRLLSWADAERLELERLSATTSNLGDVFRTLARS